MSTKKVHVLADHLKQEIRWIKELNEALQEEKQALTTNQYDKLQDLSIKKQELSHQLENSTQERIKLIGNSETQSPSAFLQEFLKDCSQEDALFIQQLNDELTVQLKLCRDLNTVNGQVIATNVYTREEIIHILSGSKVKDVSVYTATGDIKQSSKDKGGGHHEEA